MGFVGIFGINGINIVRLITVTIKERNEEVDQPAWSASFLVLCLRVCLTAREVHAHPLFAVNFLE